MFDDLSISSGVYLLAVCWAARYVIQRCDFSRAGRLLMYSFVLMVCNSIKVMVFDIPNMDTNFYWYFGVDKTADHGLIKRSFRQLSLSLHPDHNHSPDASEQFGLLNFMNKVFKSCWYA